MFRNPFEEVLNSTGPALDVPREEPRDLMADAFISQMMQRLTEAYMHGYAAGMPHPYHGAHGRHEQNGLPVGPGFDGMAQSFDRYPFDLHDMHRAGSVPARSRPATPWMGGDMAPAPFMPRTPETAEYDPRADFEMYAAPYSGPDDETTPLPLGGTPPPLTLADPKANPYGDYMPPLDALARTVRPGLASFGAVGYQPRPGAPDPYGQDLRDYLRRLLRAV